MAFIIKNTFIFSMPNHGWSETYFTSQANNDLNSAMNLTSNLAQARADLLGKDAFLQARRVSIEWNEAVPPQKVSNDAVLDKKKFTPTFVQQQWLLAQSNVAAMIRVTGPAGSRHKAIYMRGIPDDIETDDGQYNPAGAGNWGARFQTWREFYLGINGATRAGWWGQSPLVPKVNLLGYTVDPVTSVVKFTFPAGTFTVEEAASKPKKRVSFLGVNVKSVLNGVQNIQVLSQSTAQLVKPTAAGPWIADTGKMTQYDYGLIQATDAKVDSIVTHKTGAPLLASRGRAPVKART